MITLIFLLIFALLFSGAGMYLEHYRQSHEATNLILALVHLAGMGLVVYFFIQCAMLFDAREQFYQKYTADDLFIKIQPPGPEYRCSRLLINPNPEIIRALQRRGPDEKITREAACELDIRNGIEAQFRLAPPTPPATQPAPAK